MIKKITLVFSIFLINSIYAQAFYEDVPVNHPQYEAIISLYENDKLPITTNFEPNKILNKSEFYQILIEYTQVETDTEINLPYQDIKKGSPIEKYLQTAIDLQIIKPDKPLTSFNPNKEMSRYSTIKTLIETLGLGINYFYPQSDFPLNDINPSNHLAPIAYRAYELGFTKDNKFQAIKRITKGEFVEMLYILSEHITYTAEPGRDSPIEENSKYPILEDVYDTINKEYFYKEDINQEQLIYSAIKGMISSLKDPYTFFQEPVDAESFLNILSGEYEGIGIVIEIMDEKLTIISPIKGSPAEKAGLKANDIITKVNGVETKGLAIEDIANKIKGEINTSVILTIERENNTLDISVTRDSVKITSVESNILYSGSKAIAYIELNSFKENSYNEFIETINTLKKQSPKGYIIDLRNNPGGYLDVSLSIMNTFSDQQLLATTLKFKDLYEEEYISNGNGLLNGEKIVILVNEGSASASEILTGFLQDHKLATIIGTQTFGKGSAQNITKYTDKSLFKYTTALWLTPNGTEINTIGITPDKIVPPSETSDNQLQAALQEF